MNDPSGRPDGGVGEQDVLALLADLDSELIGLAPVKRRIRDVAALLVVDSARTAQGLPVAAPGLHMSFTGNPRQRRAKYSSARWEGSCSSTRRTTWFGPKMNAITARKPSRSCCR